MRWKTHSEILKLNSRSKVTAREMWSTFTFTQFGRELKLFITPNESTSNVNWMNHKCSRCVAVVVMPMPDGAMCDQKFNDYAMFWNFVVYTNSGDRSFTDAKLRYAMFIRGSFIFVMLLSRLADAVKSSILKMFFR